MDVTCCPNKIRSARSWKWNGRLESSSVAQHVNGTGYNIINHFELIKGVNLPMKIDTYKRI